MKKLNYFAGLLILAGTLIGCQSLYLAKKADTSPDNRKLASHWSTFSIGIQKQKLQDEVALGKLLERKIISFVNKFSNLSDLTNQTCNNRSLLTGHFQRTIKRLFKFPLLSKYQADVNAVESSKHTFDKDIERLKRTREAIEARFKKAQEEVRERKLSVHISNDNV